MPLALTMLYAVIYLNQFETDLLFITCSTFTLKFPQ